MTVYHGNETNSDHASVLYALKESSFLLKDTQKHKQLLKQTTGFKTGINDWSALVMLEKDKHRKQ